MAIDKLIVTNKTVLQKKYKAGFPKIEALLKKIVAADKSKGLKSKYIFVDDAGIMKSSKSRTVNKPSNEKQNKDAIDDLFHFYTPDYVLIFGSGDIIPFQSLLNDNYIATMSNRDSNDDDDERIVESDLPYACETAYNKNRRIQNYINPSRVVGRLPDVLNQADIKYINQVVDNLISWIPITVFPKNIFSVTTATWNKITDRIVLDALKYDHKSFISPIRKEGSWKKKELSPIIHLINCHGGEIDPRFWGQDAVTEEIEPASINSQDVNRKLKKGTVMVAECCFGGQLYEPNTTIDLPMSICNSYLLNGAIGFVGSSCSAFGAVNGEQSLYNADLVAKYFLRHLSEGASLGRAFLETRQEYFSKNNQPDPTDYKTIAQFNLMGDPSLHFFISKEAQANPKSKKKAGNIYYSPNRKGRRADLEINAAALKNTVSSLKEIKSPGGKALKKEIKTILKKNKIKPGGSGKTFAIQLPGNIHKETKSIAAAKSSKRIDLKYRVYSSSKKVKANGKVIKKSRILVLRELSGQIVEQKLVVSK